MAIYRFKNDHLAPLVEAGVKRATLRRGRRPAIGETLALMYGRRNLMPGASVISVEALDVYCPPGASWEPGIDGVEALARELGHESGAAASAYYAALNGERFSGYVVRW